MEPGYVPPENPHCVEFDGSLVPDCGKYLVNNVTSYYHIHEYSKFLASLQNSREGLKKGWEFSLTRRITESSSDNIVFEI